MKLRIYLFFLVCISVTISFVLIPGTYAAEILFSSENSDVVNIRCDFNNPIYGAEFILSEPVIVTQIRTHHYNNGNGAPAGTIHVYCFSQSRTAYKAQASRPSKYYWEVRPNLVFPAGRYVVITSSPETQSRNAKSGLSCFTTVIGDKISTNEKGPVDAFFRNPPSGIDGKGPVSMDIIRNSVRKPSR